MFSKYVKFKLKPKKEMLALSRGLSEKPAQRVSRRLAASNSAAAVSKATKMMNKEEEAKKR